MTRSVMYHRLNHTEFYNNMFSRYWTAITLGIKTATKKTRLKTNNFPCIEYLLTQPLHKTWKLQFHSPPSLFVSLFSWRYNPLWLNFHSGF